MNGKTILPLMGTRRRSHWSKALGLVWCLGLVMSACGDGDTPTSPTPDLPPTPPTGSTPPANPTPPPAPTSTLYQGTFASTHSSGSVEVTLQATVGRAVRAASSASGSLQLVGGGTVALAGTYDEFARHVALSGGGYDFEGDLTDSGEEIVGAFSDPAGSRGTFATLNANATAVANYCGTYSGDGAGVWNLTLGGGRVSGTWASSLGEGSGTAQGSVQGQSVSGSVRGDSSGSFSGTLRGQDLSGSWSDNEGYNGTFRGSTPCRR